jgi:dipeptidyl aminopeptidase/acylaminoacyl peptidase
MKHFIFAFLLFSASSFAQKRPLSHADFDGWKAISETKITPNGQWVSYILKPQDGDSHLIFYPLTGKAIDTVDRASDLWLSQDSEWAGFKISASQKNIRAAKLAKKKKEEMPKDSLVFHNFSSYENTIIPNVKSYVLPEKSVEWVAMLHYPAKDTTSKKAKKESDENGSKLTVFNLKTKEKLSFPFVSKFQMDRQGKNLVFATTGKDSTFKNGVYHFSTVDKKLTHLKSAKGNFKYISASEDGTHWAIVLDPDTTKKALVKNHQLHYWKVGETETKLAADSTEKESLNTWLVSGDYEPRFSKDGSKLFFGTIPRGLVKDTTRLEEEIVSVDVWNWQDKKTQPQQAVEAKTPQTYMSIFHTNNQKITKIANENISKVYLTKDANEDEILATSGEKYSHQHWIFNPPVDIYGIATKDGKTNLIAENKRISNLTLSPEGKFAVYFSLQDTAWFAYQMKNGKMFKLTSAKTFADEDDDHPDFPDSYGLAGFTLEDNTILVYDKYDIWEIDLNRPSENKRLTNGRENKLVYRYIKLDEKEIYVSKNMLLEVFDTKTKASGFATLSEGKLETKLMDNFNFWNVIKAKETEDLIFTKENFKEFPDLNHTKNVDFKDITKISNANPVMQNLSWGTAELVNWKTPMGINLEGLLYKPEGYDSTKKYPMITYFYEKYSDELHLFVVPQPARSSINFSYYVSNGYFVFVPDIVYKTGLPGESAYECIMSGVRSVLKNKYIDSTRLGIQGHSWGGYQTAYLITKTPLFKAAEAGAPVANMTSAYGGIRWESGMSRMGQYEKTQSRIGKTLWEEPQKYLENSPLFYLPNVTTPLLMMHNDDDGAVPWQQGIEMFMAMKRLGKPVWMITYNGEKHGLTQRKNRKDWSIRMAQYFDYYLKDAPQPEWMSRGIPVTEKTLNYGLKTN